MNRTEALMKAAQAWVTDKTSKYEMNVDLAEAFADILQAALASQDAEIARLIACAKEYLSAIDHLNAIDCPSSKRYERVEDARKDLEQALAQGEQNE
jgi:hypothetical protein